MEEDDDDGGDDHDEEDKTDDGDDVNVMEEDEREEVPATTEVPPAIPIPRSTEANPDATEDRDEGRVADGGDGEDDVPAAKPIQLDSSLKRKPSEMSKGGSSFHTASESLGGGDGPSDSVSKPRKEVVKP